MSDLLDERYRLYERLGEGGMAEVFRAEDLRLGREVAVKLLRAQYAGERSFLDRFINEARSMAGFSHPNVVNVYDVGRDGQRYYIVMEYVPGEDLRQTLERGPLPMRQALDIARQMAQGIGYAHRKGLVHRDIKPGNILLTPNGEVKVADFGIAKAMASAGMTEPGVVWGTTAYLSPEQVRGENATAASDVYAMGIVLYEMVAGRPPFQGEDRVAIALKHLNEEPAPFDEALQVPRGMAFLVRKALAKEPAQRYLNADDMARALSEYLRARSDATQLRTPAATVPPTTAAPSARPAPAATTVQAPNHPSERPAPTRLPSRGAQVVEAEPQGTDWTAVLLGILAALLLLGLIPLWLRVLGMT